MLISVAAMANDLRTNFASTIDAIGQEAVQNREAPGVSIAVAEGSKIIYVKGFGFANLTTNEKATPGHVFRLASVTKQFTAAAIMQLVDAGKINLDDPLTAHFSDFPPEAKKVTVAHVLQHTSGVGIEDGLKRLAEIYHQSSNRRALQSEPTPVTFSFEAGSEYRYSNVGYYLLGVLIEEVSGQTYAEYLKEHIFDPVGMKNSGYGPSNFSTPKHAQGYRVDKNDEFQNERRFNMAIPFSAGGLVSTVEDLILWQRALITGKVVSQESYKRMRTTGVLNSGKKFNSGFGLFVGTDDGLRAIKHGGNISGFSSALAYYSQRDITIAVQTNLRNGNSREILKRIEKEIF
jgi:CubicO group peptidase (beta-lactamase class C family)